MIFYFDDHRHPTRLEANFILVTIAHFHRGDTFPVVIIIIIFIIIVVVVIVTIPPG